MTTTNDDDANPAHSIRSIGPGWIEDAAGIRHNLNTARAIYRDLGRPKIRYSYGEATPKGDPTAIDAAIVDAINWRGGE